MTVQELMNFLQGVDPDLSVFVRENGVLQPSYYEFVTGEETGTPPSVMIKRKL